MKKTYSLLVFLFFVSACSGGFSIDAEKRAVNVFHKEFNQNDINAILAMATDGFKNSDLKQNLAKYFNGVYKKLGKNLSDKLINWRVFNGTSGKQVRLVYKSKFEKGDATEEFIFAEKNGKALIQHYNIESRIFITGS